MNTTPRQFRLTQETIDLIDALKRDLNLTSRAEVLRAAVRALADRQYGAGQNPPASKPARKRK